MNETAEKPAHPLRRFMTAGIDHHDDLLLLRRLVLVTSLLLMILFLFSFFSLYNALRGSHAVAALDFGGLLICLTAMWQLQVRKRLELAINTVVVALFVFLLLFAGVNQNNSYGLIWTFFFPIFTVLLKGQRHGTQIVTAFYALLLPLAYFGIGHWQGGAWDLTSFIRFSLASLVVYYSAYFNELSIQRSYNELQATRQREREAAKSHADEIHQMLESKQQLMVDISHELRTPLAAMRVNLEALEDGIIEEREGYPLLQGKLTQLNQLIEDIYHLSKADVGALSFEREPLALSPLLAEVIDGFSQQAREARIAISFTARDNGNITVNGDRYRLFQLFSNLVRNSLLYTDPGGQLQVILATEGRFAVILFQDSAPDVPDEHLPHIFERFYRVDKSRSRATGGSGLGMAICRSIVMQHGGEISATHSPLGGLQVRITLPMCTHGN